MDIETTSSFRTWLLQSVKAENGDDESTVPGSYAEGDLSVGNKQEDRPSPELTKQSTQCCSGEDSAVVGEGDDKAAEKYNGYTTATAMLIKTKPITLSAPITSSSCRERTTSTIQWSNMPTATVHIGALSNSRLSEHLGVGSSSGVVFDDSIAAVIDPNDFDTFAIEAMLSAEIGEDISIDTKELCEMVRSELERYSIARSLFAKVILNRGADTLKTIFRRPKPWSELKFGRNTYGRMYNWLHLPVKQRLGILGYAADEDGNVRQFFTPAQKQLLQEAFEVSHKPSRSVMQELAERLNLDFSRVHKYFRMARYKFGHSAERMVENTAERRPQEELEDEPMVVLDDSDEAPRSVSSGGDGVTASVHCIRRKQLVFEDDALQRNQSFLNAQLASHNSGLLFRDGHCSATATSSAPNLSVKNRISSLSSLLQDGLKERGRQKRCGERDDERSEKRIRTRSASTSSNASSSFSARSEGSASRTRNADPNSSLMAARRNGTSRLRPFRVELPVMLLLTEEAVGTAPLSLSISGGTPAFRAAIAAGRVRFEASFSLLSDVATTDGFSTHELSLLDRGR